MMNRKIAFIFLIICLVIIPGHMKAQGFWFKGGMTSSNLNFDRDDLVTKNSRTGFHAGLATSVMFPGDIFGVQAEVLYTTKGSEVEYAGVLDQIVTFNLDYIDVPLLLVLRPVPVMEIHAGAYAGYLFDSNINFTGTIDGATSLEKDNFEEWDYGLVGGVAFNLGYIKVGARYNLGIKEIAITNDSRLLLGDSKNH